MNIRLLTILREVKQQFGHPAALNVLLVLRKDMSRLVGMHASAIEEYCTLRGLKL